MAFDFDQPIIAIATASGRGGIGIVRISGKDILPIMQAVCGKMLTPRYATYLPFLNTDGSLIDQGIALYFKAPHSYTGEDVLELQAHGGPVVLNLLLQRCLQVGSAQGFQNLPALRIARPGEFTERAFLNDKLDLAQAEAVADLIDASTESAARSAAASLSGEFSKIIHRLVQRLTELRMLIEATLDFPEEEIEFLEKSNARQTLAQLQNELQAIFQQAAQGALLREGLKVVCAGQPNVGKSSLLNALAGSEVAIVTPIAGTTRDKVSETIQIEGVPIHIIDTAGLRDAQDEVERIGIGRTWSALQAADVILHIADAATGPTAADEEIAQRLPAHIPVLHIWNKIDLSGHAPSVLCDRTQNPVAIHLYLSAATGAGIDVLRTELLNIAGWQPAGEQRYLARERHLQALRTTLEHLAHASSHAATNDQALDLCAEELRLAQQALASITGEFTADDLLGEIFGRFCIGK